MAIDLAEIGENPFDFPNKLPNPQFTIYLANSPSLPTKILIEKRHAAPVCLIFFEKTGVKTCDSNDRFFSQATIAIKIEDSSPLKT